MKLYQILNLPHVYETILEKNLPFSLAYKLNKLAEAVNKELEFYRNSMTKLIDEYAEKENGQPVLLENGDIKIIPEKITECQQRINELQNVEITIDISFTPKELEPLEMSIKDLQNLMPFIKVYNKHPQLTRVYFLYKFLMLFLCIYTNFYSPQSFLSFSFSL